MVTQGADVIAQLQAHRGLDLVGAVVAVLGGHAGGGLGLLEVLFQGQTYGVGVFHVGPAVLVDITEIVRGETDLEVAHLPGPLTDQLGNVLAGGTPVGSSSPVRFISG